MTEITAAMTVGMVATVVDITTMIPTTETQRPIVIPAVMILVGVGELPGLCLP